MISGYFTPFYLFTIEYYFHSKHTVGIDCRHDFVRCGLDQDEINPQKEANKNDQSSFRTSSKTRGNWFASNLFVAHHILQRFLILPLYLLSHFSLLCVVFVQRVEMRVVVTLQTRQLNHHSHLGLLSQHSPRSHANQRNLANL
jgi:hypothetical protein